MRRLITIAALGLGLALGSSVVQAAHHEAGEAEAKEMPPVEAEPADEASGEAPAAPAEGDAEAKPDAAEEMEPK